MTITKLLSYAAVAVLSAGLFGCSASSPTEVAAGTAAADPANGNLASPDSNTASNGAPSSTVQYQNQAPPPPNYSAPAQDYSSQSGAYQSGAYQDEYATTAYDDQQPVFADQPPPPLPEYSQPPCPGENYIWTPGAWSYSSEGYYWVPGAWIVAPYVGALWTPPYWEFYEHRYRWHHGFWGTHIGFYGGIDYGFGYVGRGYYGGYWRGGQFAYNREVTNINVSVVPSANVYNYRVTNVTNVRTSYNGGPGGIGLRPTAAEVAVLHEQRMAPVAAQVAHVRQAESNRAQFASMNHGRPAQLAVAQPIATNYRAPVARPSDVPGHPALMAPRPAEQVRPGAPVRAEGRPMQAPAPMQPGRPAEAPAARMENRPALAQRPEPLRGEPMRQQPVQQTPMRAEPMHQQQVPARPAMPAPRQEPQVMRPQPEGRPSPQVQQARPAEPQHVPAARQPEAPRMQPAPRPVEAPRMQPAPRPAEAPRMQAPPRAAEPPHVQAPRPVEAPRAQPAPRPAEQPRAQPARPEPGHPGEKKDKP